MAYCNVGLECWCDWGSEKALWRVCASAEEGIFTLQQVTKALVRNYAKHYRQVQR